MSDEYSLHGNFLLGKISAAEYERRLARLRAKDELGEHPGPAQQAPATLVETQNPKLGEQR